MKKKSILVFTLQQTGLRLLQSHPSDPIITNLHLFFSYCKSLHLTEDSAIIYLFDLGNGYLKGIVNQRDQNHVEY